MRLLLFSQSQTSYLVTCSPTTTLLLLLLAGIIFAKFCDSETLVKLSTRKNFNQHRHQSKHKLGGVFHLETCIIIFFWSFFCLFFFLPVPSRARESDVWWYCCSCMRVSWPQLKLCCDQITGARCTLWHVWRKSRRRLHVCKLIPKTIGNRKRDCAWGGSGW